MNMPKPLGDITSGIRRAKGRAAMAERKVKRAEGQVKRVKGRRGRSDRSKPEPTSGPTPDRDAKPGALVPAVAGVIGAIAAPLLGLGVADNSDDRLLFGLIGLPLGAILAVCVVISYRWAGLIDR